jgi:phosphoenolpyruvate carboxykinase (ATP)
MTAALWDALQGQGEMQDRITYLSNKRDIEHDMESSFIDPLVSARLVIDKILNPI